MIKLSIFTKPWTMPLRALGRHIANLGVTAIELPVRPGYQVEPQDAERNLPEAVKVLADCGVRIASVAGPLEERVIRACGIAGVPVLRHMVTIGDDGYIASEARARREFSDLIPLLEDCGVTVGVQNHCGRMVANACGLRNLLAGFDRRHVAAVWDAAHNALAGEEPELALDLVWPHLCMVNLKNAVWEACGNDEAGGLTWRPYWTAGNRGLASWPRVAAALMARGYDGTVCLTAEYSDHASLESLIAADVAYAKRLFALEVFAPGGEAK